LILGGLLPGKTVFIFLCSVPFYLLISWFIFYIYFKNEK
jgi:hypothetical protein